MNRLSVLLLLGTFPLLGCPDVKDPGADDTAADADTDADTDADSDADSDTDTDTDTDTDPSGSFAGSLTITSAENGVTICDADVALVGTAYTGECENCDFAFAIDGTVSRDEGTGDCYLYPQYTWVADEYYHDLVLAHADPWTVSYYSYYTYEYAYYDYNDALLSGYGVYYPGYGDYPGPYWRPVAYEGSAYGSFARNGDDIEWSFDYSYAGYTYTENYYYYCDYLGYGDSEYASAVPGDAGTGTVDCDGYLVDSWTVDVDASGELRVSVDTVSDETAFDTVLMVNAADGCTLASVDDSFDCSYEPAGGQCSAIELTGLDEGSYSVVVGAWGNCNGTVAEYQLSTSGANLTQTVDDASESTSEAYSYEVTIAGSGTITP